MAIGDWNWKIGEAVERIRTRYDHIGRKTGVPFLAVIYQPALEIPFLKEWKVQCKLLGTGFEIFPLDILSITQRVISEIGADNIVESIKNPMPGSDPEIELGQLWSKAIVDEVFLSFQKSTYPKPLVCLEKMAALYPALGPRDIMQALWDSNQDVLRGPVIFLIPGTLEGPRTYNFLNVKKEFMYRGDLL